MKQPSEVRPNRIEGRQSYWNLTAREVLQLLPQLPGKKTPRAQPPSPSLASGGCDWPGNESAGRPRGGQQKRLPAAGYTAKGHNG